MAHEKEPSASNEAVHATSTASSVGRRGFLRMTAASAGLATLGSGLLTACGGGSETASPEQAMGASPKSKMDTPTIACVSATENTITLRITAGASGAPAGFSIQWESCAALAGPDGTVGTADDNAWYSSDDSRLCKASFSGNANGTNWNLAPGASITVVIGGLNDADPGVSFTCNEPLVCETCYAFRAFAHANSTKQRSDFTANLPCTTAECEPTGYNDGDFCTKSQGFYGGGGVTGRDQLIACFGGFNGAYDKDGNQTLPPNPGSCGAILVTIGGGTFSYEWHLSCTYTNVGSGQTQFLLDTGLKALRDAIGGGGTSGYFTANGSNAANMGSGGGLASQTAALTLNIALSGSACSGYPAGYGAAVLCNFTEGDSFTNAGTPISAATAAALNGQTVSQVLTAANAYLGGAGVVPLPYGLSTAGQLNELVANLNLAFDGKDWDGDTVEESECGGMSAFAESHLCKP